MGKAAGNTRHTARWIYMETQKHRPWENEKRIPSKWRARFLMVSSVCIEQASGKPFSDKGKMIHL